ncbi:MAG: sugar phosphate isomerase/epimerase [Oscillospiraceae bacterium]|jgi:sugar phosphate isomerase/epimerase|nr:sugar phosphate isomerase/epimerase [Oscillospiraceae bacterium]
MISIKIGAQLYTVRGSMQTPDGIRRTLERVAAIGYRYIQCSGFSFDAPELKEICGALALKIRLTHTPADRIVHDTDAVIAEHLLLECPYVGIGSMPREYRTYEGAKQFLRDFAPAMRAFHNANLKLQYHNHSFEFERFAQGTMFDALVRGSDPDLLGFTLDVYWVQHGGKNPVDLIDDLHGRIDVCHCKDMAIKDNAQRFAAIGDGNLRWQPIFDAFERAGTQYAFVEQDDCYGEDPIDELERSFRFLQKSERPSHKNQ